MLNCNCCKTKCNYAIYGEGDTRYPYKPVNEIVGVYNNISNFRFARFKKRDISYKDFFCQIEVKNIENDKEFEIPFIYTSLNAENYQNFLLSNFHRSLVIDPNYGDVISTSREFGLFKRLDVSEPYLCVAEFTLGMTALRPPREYYYDNGKKQVPHSLVVSQYQKFTKFFKNDFLEKRLNKISEHFNNGLGCWEVSRLNSYLDFRTATIEDIKSFKNYLLYYLQNDYIIFDTSNYSIGSLKQNNARHYSTVCTQYGIQNSDLITYMDDNYHLFKYQLLGSYMILNCFKDEKLKNSIKYILSKIDIILANKDKGWIKKKGAFDDEMFRISGDKNCQIFL